MELWLGITLVAAFLQNARSLLQKRLTGVLSVNGATAVRFFYAVPFAYVYVIWLWQNQWPTFTPEFWMYVASGAVAQIVGTALLLASFAHQNFAVGTAFSKTEAAQVAVFGLLILGDQVDIWVVSGILVSLIGVLFLSGNFTLRDLLKPNMSMWLGLAAATGFAISAVGFRGASINLGNGDFLQRAGLTVAVSVSIQSVLMAVYLGLREPGELSRVTSQWRIAVWVGLIGMVASAGWFTAMTLKNAAVVRAVGQIELLFTVATSVWLLKERLHAREYVGMALVVVGIVLLV